MNESISTNLFNQKYSLMLVKDSKTVILMEKGHQQDAEDQKENKIQGFSIKISASWTRSCRTWAIGSDLCT
jgi:hypothetical protein